MTVLDRDITLEFDAIVEAWSARRVYAWVTRCWSCAKLTTVWKAESSPKWAVKRLETLPDVRAAVARLHLPAIMASLDLAYTEESGTVYCAFRCAGEGMHVLGGRVPASGAAGQDRRRHCRGDDSRDLKPLRGVSASSGRRLLAPCAGPRRRCRHGACRQWSAPQRHRRGS